MGLGAPGPRLPARPLAAALGVVLLAAACTRPPGDPTTGPVVGPSVIPTPPTSLRVAVIPPATLDPRELETQDALLVAAQLFDGLVAYDVETLDAVPAVAESWEILDGGRGFRFRIRPGVTFHDGSPVTAASFVTAWNRLADPVAMAPYAFLLESVDGFQRFQEKLAVRSLSGLSAPDDRTLEVRLNRVWADFPSLLGHPALSPVPVSASEVGFGTQPTGNGPYRMAAPLTPGGPTILQVHDTYYGVPPAMPNLDLRPVAAPDEAWPDFLAGDLDIAEIPGPLLRQAESRFGDRGIVPLARLLSCGFNEADERFADPELRTAVSMGLDRVDIAAEVYGGVPLPATGIVPPTVPGHVADACGERCGYDPDRAAAMLAGVRQRDRAFALDYAASPAADELAAAIASQLRTIGLRVTPRPHDQASFGNVLENDQHEMFCLGAIADYPRQQALLEPLLASGGADNHANVADPRIDRLLEEAGTRRDPGVRQAVYAEVERRALAAMHVIPLVWFRSKLAVQPSVEGFRLDPLGLYDAAAISVAFPSPGPPATEAPEPPGLPGAPPVPPIGSPGEVPPPA